MDVRCERCKTEYEFDDARITESGVTVKCTTCEHVFKVKKKALVVTVPVKPGELEALPASDAPPPERSREWQVRQLNGNLFTFKELTTLQKWIVERKVSRDDEISLSGDTWKRLGNIAELSSFFQVVEEAARAQQLLALQQQSQLHQVVAPPVAEPLPSIPAGPPVQAPPPAPEPAPEVAPLPLASRVTEPRFVADRNAVRSAARRPEKGDDLDLEAAGLKRSGGTSRLLVALLLLAALGAGGWYGYQNYWLPSQAAKAPPPVAQAVPAPVPEPEPVPGPTEPVVAPTSEPEPVATPEPAAPAPGTTPAGAAESVPAAAVAPAPAPTPAPAPRERAPAGNFDQLLGQGDRLRLRDRPEQALASYEKAIELKPDRAEPVAGRGLALLDMGQKPAAEAAFREALRLNPRYAVAVMGLAEAYRQQGKKADAVEQYRKYLDILPNGPEAPVARSAIERLKE